MNDVLPPARLFVLLAREAPIGVIIRRGPTDWVQLIYWDTKNDVFTPGQWFHGRIYEHRSDLSPNGRYFVYLAYKPGHKVSHPNFGDRWTAVSRPPYFTALALWPLETFKGGGGFFTERKKMLLNHFESNQTLHPNYSPPDIEIENATSDTFMMNSIFFHRMRSVEWSSGQTRLPFWFKGKHIPSPGIVRSFWKQGLICDVRYSYRPVIKRAAHQKSLYEIVPNFHYRFDGYDIRARKTVRLNMPDVTWADYDQQHRLIIAKEGKIFSAALQNGELVLTELADFNANKPEPVETPEWAKEW